MKPILALLLILCAGQLIAQRLAVKFYGSNTNGIHAEFPTEVREIGDVLEVPSGFNITMPKEDFAAFRDARIAGWNAFQASREAAEVNTRNARLQTVSDIFDRLETAQRNWSVLTQLQISGVVSNQNLLLLQLRPLLRELYESKER